MSAAEIIFIAAAVFLAASGTVLFLQIRRHGRVMRAVANILMAPSRAKISEAKDMVDLALNGLNEKMAANFDAMAAVLAQHAARAEMLEKKLGIQNKLLVATSDAASERIANMARTLENLVGNLSEILDRDALKSAVAAVDGFNDKAGNLMKELESKSDAMLNLSRDLNSNILNWSESGRKFADELHQNIADSSDRVNMLAVAVKGMNGELCELQRAVSLDFDNVKLSSQGIENVLANSGKLLGQQLEKMEHFAEQAKKLLQSQVNAMSDTAARIGTDIRLAESSIGDGADKLSQTTEKLFSTSKAIKETFDAIAGEIMSIRAKFQTEVGDFSKNVVVNLQNAEVATARTMDNATHIAGEFRDSVVPMLAHIGDAVRGLADVSEKMRPLSGLIRELESALPSIADKSGAMTSDMARMIGEMAAKMDDMNDTAARAMAGVGDSAVTLEKLAGASRQQMIDLVSDCARAAESVRELTAGMAAERAAAPMKAMGSAVRPTRAAASLMPVQDFIKSVGGIMEKLHDLSVDLTRSIGAEIPDSIMDKYNSGDRAIFSKWFAKMIKNADKKRVRDMFKTDAVFRSQATQFVHAFARMISGAERTDNREMVAATLLKTDLGIMYQALKACLG